ncbi:alpha/beta hydrolase [Rhizobium sp. BK060]|uniref:alpha/beta hydrolase n=1 Tax=Rhizobium sp. BK060 TaxID=2587096 RepID=UPI00160BC63C|nr:alpha/beta hydrolase [Rhizobium sp. BK060]MBB3396020.1 phospholipase/carboxylesterase [Rhizobium sp. BK060]
MSERQSLQGFEYHVFGKLNEGSRPILAFHKTGGDENELVPLARIADPDAPIVGLRGQVVEDGKLRFFKRLGTGQLDEADLERRADNLNAFILEFVANYRVKPPVAIGLSNGANIIVAALYRGAPPLSAALLLRPAVPFKEARPVPISGTRVFVVGGMSDEVVTPAETMKLTNALRAAGAHVDLSMVAAGHRPSVGDEAAIRGWLKRI